MIGKQIAQFRVQEKIGEGGSPFELAEHQTLTLSGGEWTSLGGLQDFGIFTA